MKEAKVNKLVLFSFHFLRYTRNCVISALTLQRRRSDVLSERSEDINLLLKSVKVQKGRAYPTQRPFV